MKNSQLKAAIVRCAVMLAGMFCIGAGIALAKRSGIGTSPISCIPAVLSNWLPSVGVTWISLGVLTFSMNFVFLLIEIALLRRRFPPIQLTQLLALFVMSWSIDLWGGLFAAIPVDAYLQQLACVVVSVAVMALGVYLEVYADVLMVPAEAVVKVISYVGELPFGRVKVAFDSTLIALAAALSLLLLGGLYGVREGSLLSALLVGNVVPLWRRALDPLLGRLVPVEGGRLVTPVVPTE